MNHRPSFHSGKVRHQQGVSLIELMVALVIAGLLAIGLVQVFGGTRMAFNSNTSLARAQENARFALRFLNEDIRMAGHLGTRNEQEGPPDIAEVPFANRFFNHMAPATGNGRPNTAPWAFRLEVPLEVYEFTGTGIADTYEPDYPLGAVTPPTSSWSPSLPPELNAVAAEALAGSDIIVVRYLSADFVTLVNSRPRADGMPVSSNPPFASGSGMFYWDNTSNPAFIVQDGVYAFSNAESVSLFQVTAMGTPSGGETPATAALDGLNTRDWATTRPVGATGELENSANYGSLLPVHRYEMAIYYVALDVDGEPALFRRRLDPATPAADNYIGARESMVPGVESLQVVLGAINRLPRQSDQPGIYLTADQVDTTAALGTTVDARWRSVVNVRLGLLMRSQLPGDGIEAGVTRDVAGTLITPGTTDRRLRYAYETQISLRNRNRG